MEIAADAPLTRAPVNLSILRGWSQRAISLLGNANAAISAERMKTILMMIDPKLSEMVEKELGPEAERHCYSYHFVKDISSYVQTFTTLDKAQ